MKTIFSTAYLPSVEYFAWLIRAEHPEIECMESYSKQTYRNRCIIAGPNGRQVLTVPVIHTGGGSTGIRKVEIDYSKRWQSIHWRSIEAAYNKSPFFHYYREAFMPYFLSHQKFLYDLNHELFNLCMKLAGLKTHIGFTMEFRKIYDDAMDLRNLIHPKNRIQQMDFPRYPQVFEGNLGFLSDLSIIDLLFNRGPDTGSYLESVRIIQSST